MVVGKKSNQMVNNIAKNTILIIYILFGSCLNGKDAKIKENIVFTNNEMKINDYLIKLKPDTTVNNKLMLLNSTSINENLPTISKTPQYNDYVFVLNTNGDECLSLGVSYGGTANEFISFDIFYKSDKSIQKDIIYQKIDFNKISFYQSNYNIFFSESNIKLGMSKEEIVKIKGTNFKKSIVGNVECLIYEIDNIKSSFLIRYNMPAYTAKYYYNKGILIRFSYGFEIP